MLVAYAYPAAIRSTWGRMADELSDATWAELDVPPGHGDVLGFGMFLKMSRCHDLGLAQLFFPDEDMDEEGDEESEGDGRNGLDGLDEHGL